MRPWQKCATWDIYIYVLDLNFNQIGENGENLFEFVFWFWLNYGFLSHFVGDNET